ncbi:MAG: LysM peptidoglycan-binding domain-containing protein [Elusimicrobia bacterium]|nr:LysM peptidoglycan-binding domain-containing protein [Elusimicrobiota bacterium]
MRTRIIINLFIFSVPSLSFAASFHDLLPGARPNGIGFAYAAIADDAYSIFYNPAGLAGKTNLEMASGIGRRFSPLGSVGEMSLAYSRPLPEGMFSNLSGVAVSAGYYGLRQNRVGDKDVFLFSWAQPYPVPHFQKPVKWGASFRMESVRQPGKSRFGVGMDVGGMLESVRGGRVGLSLMEVVTDVGASTPFIHLGAAYPYGFIHFIADMRIRKGLAEFYPGMEMTFLRGLLALRAGKAVRLDGVSQISFGLGVSFSPLLVDVAMTLPWRGFQEVGGMYQASVSYRFGVPSFTESYVGQASQRSEVLKREIGVLEDRKRSLEQDVKAAEVNKSVTESDLRNVLLRLEDNKLRLKNLELEVFEKEREKLSPSKPKPKSIAPVPQWPRRHRVVQGDTLRSIASQVYGDPNLWELIYEANLNKISRGLPHVGTELVLPAPPHKR